MLALRRTMLSWAYFIGIGAIWGSIMFFIDSSGVMWGMEPILAILKTKLPIFGDLFNNFTASGIVLFLVVGLPNIISVILTHKRSEFALVSNIISAIMLILWVLLEFYVWGLVPLSVAYLIFGILQLTTSIWLQIKERTVTK